MYIVCIKPALYLPSKTGMATDCESVQDPIEILINEAIDELIDVLECRRSKLITEVRETRLKLDTAVRTNELMKEQLTQSINQLEANLRENPLQDFQEKVVNEMQERIKEIEAGYQIKVLKFICETSGFKEQLANLGEIVEVEETCSPDYDTFSLKVSVGAYGTSAGEFACPQGVTVNVSTNEIFVADSENGRVQIFSENGNFVKEFGKDVFELPYGVAIDNSLIYVTDWGHNCVFKYKLTELKNIKSVGRKGSGNFEFNMPRQIAISGDEVYIADCNNHRVNVFDKEFETVYHINHEQLKYPSDVKTTGQHVYVLSSKTEWCIHIFTPKGDYIRGFLTQGHKSDIMKARFFCFDSEFNFVISDMEDSNIKIFSKEGELLHTIGEKGFPVKTFYQPQGVAMLANRKLICVSHNYKSALQIFA